MISNFGCFIVLMVFSLLPIARVGAETSADEACIENPAKFVWTQEEGSLHGMTRFSLNLDSKEEPVVFIAAKSLIGNGGGPYHAFRPQNKCYRYLGTLLLERDAFQVLNTKHQGLSDIKSYSHTSAGSGTLTLYQFDGSKYTSQTSREIASKDFDKEISPIRLSVVETTKDGEHWNP